MRLSALFLLAAFASFARAELPPMPVEKIVEECMTDSGAALVRPERLELSAKMGPESPWGFCFAGFETRWNQPIELEVTGSGGYAVHDVNSIAAIALDYGGNDKDNNDKWIERHFFGLGFIQKTRLPHPPGWGVGTHGKLVLHDNLVTASDKPQRITLDPAKYAPKDWNGKLWIGLMLHNVGPGKSLTIRIVNAKPPQSDTPSLDDPAQLAKAHHHAFLQQAAAAIQDASASTQPAEPIVPEMAAYLDRDKSVSAGDDASATIPRALESFDKSPPSNSAFFTLAEQFFSWQHKPPGPSQIQQFNNFFKQWKSTGQFGDQLNCILRTATNLEKVALTDVTSGKLLTRDSTIELSAARREYEGFQLIFTPLPEGTEHVTVTMDDLKSDAATIPASEITINPVGYVKLFPGQPRQRYVPDPFLPSEIPPLKTGENQPVWITIHVPTDAPAGEYHSTLTIAGAKSRTKIPVALKVRSFEIPKQISLRSSFWMFRDALNRFYHLDEISFDDYMKWIDFALEHRIHPIDVFEGQCKPLLDICKPTPVFNTDNWNVGKPDANVDFTLWDKYLDHLIAGGANTLPLGTTHHFGSLFREKKDEVGTPVQIERLKQGVKIMADHYKQRGIFNLHYLQLRDEVSDEPAMNTYRVIHDSFPDVKLLLTAMPPKMKPYLEIPCPLSRGFDPSWRDDMHKQGNEYWWYVCLDPEDPYANLLLHQQASQHRALFWQTWSHNVDGLLYWGLNYWAGYEFKWPQGVGAQTTRIAREDWPAPIPIPDHPGDGFSMYPGPTPAQPMSSIRLECMRDGEEDYEYFKLFDAAIDKAQTSKRADAAVRQAIAGRDEAKKLVEHLTDYEKQPQPYLDIRNKVAESIEALQK